MEQDLQLGKLVKQSQTQSGAAESGACSAAQGTLAQTDQECQAQSCNICSIVSKNI